MKLALKYQNLFGGRLLPKYQNPFSPINSESIDGGELNNTIVLGEANIPKSIDWWNRTFRSPEGYKKWRLKYIAKHYPFVDNEDWIPTTIDTDDKEYTVNNNQYQYNYNSYPTLEDLKKELDLYITYPEKKKKITFTNTNPMAVTDEGMKYVLSGIRDAAGTALSLFNPSNAAYADMGLTNPFVYSDFDWDEVNKGRDLAIQFSNYIQSRFAPSTYVRMFIPKKWQQDNPTLDLGLMAGDFWAFKKASKGLEKFNNPSKVDYINYELLLKPFTLGTELVVDDASSMSTPGYLLGPLMNGSILEKQLSKNGTISANSIRALAEKSSAAEKAIMLKVLEEKFANQKAVNYLDYKKAVQLELTQFEVDTSTGWANRGINHIRFSTDKTPLMSQSEIINLRKSFLEENGLNDVDIDTLGDFIFPENYTPLNKAIVASKFNRWLYDKYNNDPYGEVFTFKDKSGKIMAKEEGHYGDDVLGHIRVMRDPNDPNVFYTLEYQSDWAQRNSPFMHTPKTNIENNLKGYKLLLEKLKSGEIPETKYLNISELEKEIFLAEQRVNKLSLPYEFSPEELYLRKNYDRRSIYEVLKMAAEEGKGKVRFPTRETAAKIELYKKKPVYSDPELASIYKAIIEYIRDKNFSDMSLKRQAFSDRSYYTELLEKLETDLKSFGSKYETVLKRYSDFPNMYKKMFKNSEIKVVTDSYGNTWYEVDVPKDFLQLEWKYKWGGKLISKRYK